MSKGRVKAVLHHAAFKSLEDERAFEAALAAAVKPG